MGIMNSRMLLVMQHNTNTRSSIRNSSIARNSNFSRISIQSRFMFSSSIAKIYVLSSLTRAISKTHTV